MAGGLVMLQILLGVATFRLHLQVEPLTVSHQFVGAALLGVLVAYTVLAMRDAKGGMPFDRATQTRSDHRGYEEDKAIANTI
jgi:cytochrome c oxidase assembly protein subunit 15